MGRASQAERGATPGRRIVILVALLFFASSCAEARCADGFVETNGDCIDPNVPARCAEPCSAQEFCDGGEVPATCKCLPGYEGDPCAWVGVVDDPDFRQEIELSGWQNDGTVGAVILTDAVNSVGRGEASLDASVVCNGGGLSQELEMPPYAPGVSLIAEIRYLSVGVGSAALGFGRAWRELPDTEGSWRDETLCLGEAAYGTGLGGGSVTVRLAASERAAGCVEGAGGGIRVDRFEIRPGTDGQCPAPGEVVNGGANAGLAGWTFPSEGDASGGLESGVGREVTSGARLTREAHAVGRAAMVTKISVPMPDDTGFPALAFWWRGSAGELFDASIGRFENLDRPGRPVETLNGRGAGQNYLYCLPPWTYGSVLDLAFALPGNQGTEAVELVVDDFGVRTTDECSIEDELLDPGFDDAPKRWLGSRLRSVDADVLMRAESTLSRNGSEGVLELSYWSTASEIQVERYVLVPSAEDGEGPALTFYSRGSPPIEQSRAQWHLGAARERSGPIQTADTWEPNLACLPSSWAGRWYRVSLEVSSQAPPVVELGTQRIFLDDFSLGTSADCSVR